MADEIKNIAIIGANKEGLKLLPILLQDKRGRVRLIVDNNRDAMLFKLKELGYKLSDDLDIKVSNDIEDIKRIDDLDVIINALQDSDTDKFLEAPEFRDIEKLRPLSTRLIWGLRAPTRTGADGVVSANEQTALLASFREIVDAVRLSIDRKELLSVILKLATESTRAERGSIMLVSQEEGTLRVEIAKGMDDEVVRKIRVALGEGISGKVAVTGKPLLISGKADSQNFSRPMDRSDVKSAMCVPLVVKGEIIGVVNVNSSESSHIFTGDDLNFLTSLAGLAAEIIQRSNEFELLRVDAAKFTFWKEVDSIISSRLPLEKRLNIVAKKLSELIPGLTSYIYIYDSDTDKLFLKASSIRDAKGLGLLSLRPGEGFEGQCLEEKRDIFLVDRTEEGNIKRIYVALPMMSHGTKVGVFMGQVVSANGLSKYHESFLKDMRSLVSESVYKFKQTEDEKLRSRRMFAVDEAGLEIISVEDPMRLGTIVATTPAAIVGAEGSLLRLKQDGTQKFSTAASFGLDDKSIREYFLPLEKEMVMEVLRKKEPVAREFSEEVSPYIRSVMSLPVKVGENIVGVLTFFNKTTDSYVYPCAFSRADIDIVKRFMVYAEKALSRVYTGRALADQGELGKEQLAEQISPIALFEKRVEQELNRARRFDKNLVLATVRIAGLKEPGFKNSEEFEHRFTDTIRKNTRSFDVVVKLNEETYGFLFLDTSEKIRRLLESVAEMLTSYIDYNKAFTDGRIEILYGYSTFPRDGDSFTELYSKATTRERFELKKNFNPEF